MNLETQNSRDKRSEVLTRLLALGKNINAFYGKTAEQVFQDEVSVREMINNLTFEEFTELLNGVNGILRDKPKGDWKADGKDVTLSSAFFGENAPPHHKDKPDLLQKTFSALKEMNAQNRSLEDIGILLGVSINEIHPYNDANGRTGRFVYILLSWGINKEKIKEVLGESGRDVADLDIQFIETVVQENIRDRVIQKEDESFHGLFYMGVPEEKFDSSISEEAKTSFVELLEQNKGSDPLIFAVYEWVKNNKADELLKESLNKSRVIIRLDELLPKLNEADLKLIEDRFWDFKKETAELLIDSIANPDKPEYHRDNQNIQGSILDHIKKWILTHYARYVANQKHRG